MKIEPVIISQETAPKDAFNKKLKLSEMGFSTLGHCYDLVLSTTAGIGLQLIKWNNQLPIACLSTPANVAWHCPAIYLKDQDAFYGIPKTDQSSLCKWKAGDKYNAPEKVKKLNMIPVKLGNINDGIAITFGNGKVEILDCDLNELGVSDQFLEYKSVFFTDFYCFNNDFKVIVVGTTIQQNINLSLYHYRNDGKGQWDCLSSLSVKMEELSPETNYAFSFDGKHLAVIDESFNVFIFTIRNNSIDCLAHDFSTKLNGAKLLSLKLVANNHLSILCAVRINESVIPHISTWDNRFGTLQSEIDIDTITLPDKLNRTQGFLNGFYDESGYFLTLSLTKSASSSVNTMHLLFPMKIEKITVKSSLGKLSKSSQISNALAELKIDDPSCLSQDCLDLNALNREYHANLLKNVSKDKFEEIFRDWVVSNLGLLSRKQKNANQRQLKHWTEWPAMPISQIQLKDIAHACFENMVNLWPQNVIKYCLNNGMFYSAILDSSLIETIISKDDIEILWLAAHKLLDISEKDWALILKYILGISDTQELDKRFLDFSRGQNIAIGESRSLSCGQEYICHLVFSASRNNHLMVRALSILQLEEVEKLLLWICQVVSMEDERFMWWIWDGIGSDKSREKLDAQFQTRKLALDALSLLVDSHLIMMSTSPHLVETLSKIRTYITRECQYVSEFQNRVFGLLKQFKKEVPSVRASSSSYGKRRWKRMVSDVHDSTGNYCVEVLKL